MSKRFIITVLTLIVILIGAGVAIFLAKGYRVSPETGQIAGTGILSINSVPDQASVYLDGHLTSATNTNINSLPPKKYNIKIVKDRYITWEKDVEVREGLVSQIKATLFRSIPNFYPFTYSGVQLPTISSDEQKLAYIVPGQDKKSGVYVWPMSDRTIGFVRSGEPRQILQTVNGLDLSKAQLKFSPDSNQLLVSLPSNNHYLLDINRLNDEPRDIAPVLTTTLKSWQEDEKEKEITRLEVIKDNQIKKVASSSAYLKWSPDESRILYSQDGKKNFKVLDLATRKEYQMPEVASYSWLPDSEHLILVEPQVVDKQNLPSSQVKKEEKSNTDNLVPTKVSVVEYDGFNKAEVYAGNIDPNSVFSWPDGSRIIVVSFLPTATASAPNLFGIDLK